VRDGKRGVDGWGRYTRRRKWYRDAELVEATPSNEPTPVPTPRHAPVDVSSELDSNQLTRLSSNLSTATSTEPTLVDGHDYAASIASDTDAASTKTKRSWFKKNRRSKSASGSVSNATVASSTSTDISRRSDEDDLHSPLERNLREDEWRLGDDIRQHLDI